MAILLILLIGCSKSKENDQTKEEEADLKYTFPFTGIKTNEQVNQRPVAVMVNNHPQARPQTGLSKADIVFEILAEGDITRFLAIYQSEMPEVVGPVRSAREYYFELANGYDALYVYHGAIYFINDMIKDRGIDYIDGFYHDNDGRLFKRESFKKAPHNSYLQFDAVYDEAEAQGYDIIYKGKSLAFLDEQEGDGQAEAASHVEIAYSKSKSRGLVEYMYDEQKDIYLRKEDQEDTVEMETKEPIQLNNIFIVEAHHQVIDDEGRRAIDLTAGGDAYLLQKGKMKRLKWENRDGKLVPIENGEPVGFVPGKTWVNVVPSQPGMDQSVTVLNE